MIQKEEFIFVDIKIFFIQGSFTFKKNSLKFLFVVAYICYIILADINLVTNLCPIFSIALLPSQIGEKL